METITRRTFVKKATAVALASAAPLAAAQETKAKVYFTRELSPEALIKMYKLVGGNLDGKIAIKLHTGEPHGPNIIPAAWVKELLPNVPNGTIVECNVLYPSPRQTTASHREVLKTNGWTFAPVDIMDETGEVELPVKGGKWLKSFRAGKNIQNYDSMLVLTHFKGHPMGGMGGSLKNIAIGCGSGNPHGGKDQLHLLTDNNGRWVGGKPFMERMAEGGKAITDHFGKKIVYINVLRNMSVDCDCMGTAAAPVVTPNIGILASTDILAIDQASVDLVKNLPDGKGKTLMDRINSREGLQQLVWMKHLGMGNDKYDLIEVK